MKEELKQKILEVMEGRCLFEEPMSDHSTMKVGGVAEIFATPENMEELIRLIKVAKDFEAELFFIGAGSNVIFRDAGFDGIVVSTANFNKLNVKEKTNHSVILEGDAGVLISQLVNFSVEEGMSGFEYLAGIPGTIGGGLYMNAGTHDGVISDPLSRVDAVDKAGKIYQWPKEKLEFSYRRSKFPKSCMILSAEFLLKTGSKEEIEARALQLKERRRARHPLAWPSAGSVFKNPEKGVSAGQLIEETGLKGVRVGGARVANEHGNWIVNENNATAKDVEILVHLIRERVKEETDIVLEPEIIIVGRRE